VRFDPPLLPTPPYIWVGPRLVRPICPSVFRLFKYQTTAPRRLFRPMLATDCLYPGRFLLLGETVDSGSVSSCKARALYADFPPNDSSLVSSLNTQGLGRWFQG